MLLMRSSGEVEPLGSSGKPLGLLPDERFESRRFRLGPSDALCLFTDGLVEAGSPSGEEFGLRRVADLWQDHGESPLDLTRSIYGAVREHQTKKLFEDDLTFLVAERADRER